MGALEVGTNVKIDCVVTNTIQDCANGLKHIKIPIYSSDIKHKHDNIDRNCRFDGHIHYPHNIYSVEVKF